MTDYEKYDDEKYQHYILNTIMSDKELFLRCQNIVEPKYFKGRLSKAVEYIKDFTQQYPSIPTANQVEANTNVKIEKDPDINIFQHEGLLQEIESFCKHQAFVKAIIEGSKSTEKGRYLEARKYMEDALMVGLQKDLGTDYFSDPKSRNEALKNAQGTISTGWKDIDYRLFGGFGTGELNIFVAPSGGGKSVALQNISLNFAKNGLNGVYISLELKEELVSQRMDSMLTGMTKSDLYNDLDLAAAAVQKKGKSMGRLWVKRMPETATTVNDIKVYLKELVIKESIKIDYIAVDYLDLLGTPMADSKDVFQKDKYVSEELRGLAHELDLCVITASQLNRCIEFNSEVNINGKGLIPIKDVEIGDMIYCGSGNYNKIVNKTAPELKQGFKIKTSLGSEIICTREHLFPTDNGVEANINSGLSTGSTLKVKINVFTWMYKKCQQKLQSNISKIKKLF